MRRKATEFQESNTVDRNYVKFPLYDLPLASSMAELYQKSDHSFQKFFCLWITFNHIYARISERRNHFSSLNRNKFRNRETIRRSDGPFRYGVRLSERTQIEYAIGELDPVSMDVLIRHRNVEFFVNRRPYQGIREFDENDRLINGVLNVSQSTEEHPVFSPINQVGYHEYLLDHCEDQAKLARQIVFLIYTIRNNLFHGQKRANDEYDLEVVNMALPLLRIIVESYFSGRQDRHLFIARNED